MTISARVHEAEHTERQIDEARNVYRPVPIRASLLYFVVADLVRNGFGAVAYRVLGVCATDALLMWGQS